LQAGSSDAVAQAKQAWESFDFSYAWSVSWRNIPAIYYSTRPYKEDLTLQCLVDASLAAAFPNECKNLTAAAVVCGDMSNDREFVIDRYRTIRIRTVHGYDLTPRVADGADSTDFEFIPHAADCNNLVLAKDSLHFIVAHDAYHHVYNVSNLFFQCNQALKDGGIMYVEEYIGPRYLQISFANYWVSRILLACLFTKKERTTHEGRIKGKWMCYPPGTLDPSEACNSEVIEREMAAYFEPLHILRFGGLCFPMFEGLGRNFPRDSWRFRFVIYLERALQHLGIIKPMFLQAVVRKKKVW
jgi:SAM-dependent methyltransferase